MESIGPTCQLCGDAYDSRRSDSKYCKGCKQKAYRIRKKKEAFLIKVMVPSATESGLAANTVKSAAEAQKVTNLLNASLDTDAIAEIKSLLLRVIYRAQDVEVQRIIAFDKEEMLRDYSAYCTRTGLF